MFRLVVCIMVFEEFLMVIIMEEVVLDRFMLNIVFWLVVFVLLVFLVVLLVSWMLLFGVSMLWLIMLVVDSVCEELRLFISVDSELFSWLMFVIVDNCVIWVVSCELFIGLLGFWFFICVIKSVRKWFWIVFGLLLLRLEELVVVDELLFVLFIVVSRLLEMIVMV